MLIHVFAAGPTDALFNGLGINGLAFISQLISFGIVFFLLWRFFLPAVLRILDRREAQIREGVENAEKARQQLADANAQAEQIMIDARRQAQENAARIQQNANREAEQIRQEAHTQAEQISQQQVERIRQEAARARADISREIVNLSIAAAGRVIEKSVDSNDNRRLVEEFVTTSQAEER